MSEAEQRIRDALNALESTQTGALYGGRYLTYLEAFRDICGVREFLNDLTALRTSNTELRKELEAARADAARLTAQRDAWKSEAEKWTAGLEENKWTTDNHDVGFMQYCSFGNGYRLTNNEKYGTTMVFNKIDNG